MSWWLLVVVAFLAYANGANDNFKGVATLFGSRTADYRKALWWATGTTLAGSWAAALLSGGLVRTFSGKGLVPDVLTTQPAFLLAVGLGAASTVLMATATGLPISTTHAMTGALVGAGLVSAGTVHYTRLGQMVFLPLAISPFVSFALTALLYPTLRGLRVRLGVEREMCLCVDGGAVQPVALQPNGSAVLRATGTVLTVGQLSQCVQRYHGRVFGIDCQWMLDRLHYISAGAVSFARGLNDTPKIVALLVAARGLGLSLSAGLAMVGAGMAIGGLLNARKVAMTMSERITTMNHGQGFTANLVTAVLVMFASRWGLPVSTTHVSCGSLFGLGTVNQSAQWGVIRTIVLSWMVTLPLGALLAAGLYGTFQFLR
ncbi:MAG: inorganic phosphate transporter [Candidatus Omnitrophica bacterium]|nr:inorganic phosphate transporter [Candidatus Omnitrophota bacterium]